MIIKYKIGTIGVYVENNQGKWYNNLESQLFGQLDGFQIQDHIDSRETDKKIIFKEYSKIEENYKDNGIIVPGNSLLNDHIFINEPYNMALQIEKNVITVWVNKNLQIAIPFIVGLLLKQDNQMFVHAAGISKGNKGILLLAFGGIGKTSFISRAANQKDVKILGDDLIAIDKEGNMYPYLRPFCLYPYHKVLFKEYFAKYKPKIKKLSLHRRALRKIKFELGIRDSNIYSYVTVAPNKLFLPIQLQNNKVSIDSIFVLKRYRELRDIQVITNYDITKTINFAISVIWHEWSEYTRLVLNLLGQKDEDIVNFFNFYKDIAKNCFKQAKNIVCIKIPENMKAEEVSDRLNKIIFEN